VLAGGGAELKGLSERLAAVTGMTVEIFRPMVNVSAAGVDGIKALEPALAVSCGLALSNTLLRRTMRPRINLVPKRARRAAIIRDISPQFGRKIAVPVLLGVGLSFYGYCAVEVSRKEAAMEKKLQAAVLAEKASHLKVAKKKPAPAPVKRVQDPYAFLSRLSVSGIFGGGGGATVMFGGGGSAYVAREGRLFDGEEKAVSGVASEIIDRSVVLTAGGKRYALALPK
jgi:cell division ATPase FtsA